MAWSTLRNGVALAYRRAGFLFITAVVAGAGWWVSSLVSAGQAQVMCYTAREPMELDGWVPLNGDRFCLQAVPGKAVPIDE